jgi:hypothetical protein
VQFSEFHEQFPGARAVVGGTTAPPYQGGDRQRRYYENSGQPQRNLQRRMAENF